MATTYTHTSRGMACFLAIISTFALIISALHTYYTKMLQDQCNELMRHPQFNYTLIALSGALMIILWVFFGITWVQKQTRVTVRTKNAWLVIAWVLAVAGTVIACLHEANVRTLNNQCDNKEHINHHNITNNRWISYSMITVFGVTTILLMAWIYIHSQHAKHIGAADAPHHREHPEHTEHRKHREHHRKHREHPERPEHRERSEHRERPEHRDSGSDSSGGGGGGGGDGDGGGGGSDSSGDSSGGGGGEPAERRSSAKKSGARGGGSARRVHWRELSGAPLYRRR